MMSRSSMNKNITVIKKLAHLGKYQEAAKIADEIRWGRVKEVKTLNMVSDIYEKCERYHDAKRVMMVVYNRVDANKRLVYKMCELSAKAGDLADAEEFYWEFSNLAPKDSGKLILAYYIMSASNESYEKKIEVLELYIKEDFDEKWAYKLAQLYYKTGQTEKCVRICDEIILWYSGDRYGAAALRLKHKCLGIEDEAVQPKVKLEIENEAEFDKTEEVLVESEVAEDLVEEEDEKNDEIIIENEEIEIFSESKNESDPELWFEFKSYNKDDIICETEQELGSKTEEEFDTKVEDVRLVDSEDVVNYVEIHDGIEVGGGTVAYDDNEDNCEERIVYREVNIEDDSEEDSNTEDDNEENYQDDICVMEVIDESTEECYIVLEKSTDREKIFVFGKQEACSQTAELREVENVSTEESVFEDIVVAEKVCEEVPFRQEQVFVFNQDVEEEVIECERDTIEVADCDTDKEVDMEDTAVQVVDEPRAIIEDAIDNVVEDPEKLFKEMEMDSIEEDTEELVATDIFIASDVFAETSDEEVFDENEIFTEEVCIDENVADNDDAEDVVTEEIEEYTGDATEKAEEYAEEIAEECTEEATEETEEHTEEVTEEMVEGCEDEKMVVREAVELKFEEAAVTMEEDDSSGQKVTFVGYIDEENKFTPATEEADAEKEVSKKMTENPIAEKNDQQKKLKYGYDRKLRILLVECSQMKGSVKYTANKLHSIHQQEGTKLHGIARISDAKLSVRGAESAIAVLRGRDLIVEGVEGITYEVVNELMDLLDEDMKPTILAIVDTPTRLALFVNRHRTFADRCEYIYEEASVSRREFLNYINNYAYKLAAVLDDMAEEELEYIADEMIEDGISFTISDAVALVERAFEKAQKPGLKGLFEAKKDSDGYLILRARHFDRG